MFNLLGKKKFIVAVLSAVLAVGAAGCGEPDRETLRPDEWWTVFSETSREPEAANDVAVAESAANPDTGETVSGTIGTVDGEGDPAGISTEPYAYQTLTEEEQTVYGEIVQAFTERAEEARISTTDPAVMERAYTAVRCDHCEFFWVEEFAYVTYTRGDVITAISVRPGYAMTAEEQALLQTRIDAEADRMLADVPADGSDFDKALYVYETLIREVDYDINAADNQTIVGAFLNHATVCQGYSYATQYLLGRLGIPCATVTGTADGEAHAWNLVFMDGAYYYVDTTWGNSLYVSRNEYGTEDIVPYKYVDYDYFGLTTQLLLATHQPDGDIPLPVCTATADNYYVHEGLYIESWDADRIGDLFRRGYENGEDIVRVRFSDSSLYEQALTYFLDEGNLFRWCDGLQSVRYMENPDSNVLAVVFS